MLRPIDRTRRDGPLYPGSPRTLRDCIAPNHLLLHLDSTCDFAALAADLEAFYHPRLGRPGIHPEVVLRALLLAAIYEVPGRRALCARIAENLAWRWFCLLTLDDPVFDHSTLSVFLDRVGADGVQRVFDRLNDALLAAGLLSQRVYLDSSLLPADVRTERLTPRDPDDPPLTGGMEQDDGVWMTREGVPGTDTEPARIVLRRYQDAAGRLPLPLHDPDARWRGRRGRAILGYKQHLIADRSGFILAQRHTGADVADTTGALPLFDHLPLPPTRLTADTGYRAGRFRRILRRRGITSYIPLDPIQRAGVPEGFVDHHDHLLCPTGHRLHQRGVPDREDSVLYAAQASDCRPCPLRATCLAPSMRAKQLWLSWERLETQRAARRNQTIQYQREMRRRKTVFEGVFARLDRLGGPRAQLRGCERVQAQATVTAIAHNLLKALTKRRFWDRDGAVLPPSAPPAASSAPLPAAVSFLAAPLRSSLLPQPSRP
jgi:transposase